MPINGRVLPRLPQSGRPERRGPFGLSNDNHSFHCSASRLGFTVGLSCVPHRASLKKHGLVNVEGDIKDEALEAV